MGFWNRLLASSGVDRIIDARAAGSRLPAVGGPRTNLSR